MIHYREPACNIEGRVLFLTRATKQTLFSSFTDEKSLWVTTNIRSVHMPRQLNLTFLRPPVRVHVEHDPCRNIVDSLYSWFYNVCSANYPWNPWFLQYSQFREDNDFDSIDFSFFQSASFKLTCISDSERVFWSSFIEWLEFCMLYRSMVYKWE